MLEALKRNSKSLVIRCLLLLVLIGFVAVGFLEYLQSPKGTHSLVKVGNTQVSKKDYELFYKSQIDMLSREMGQPITPQMAKSMELENQVLRFLISGALLDEQARLLKLQFGEDLLAKAIKTDPAFKNTKGIFSREKFEEILKKSGITTKDYFKIRQSSTLRQQIIAPISTGIYPSNIFLEAIDLYETQRRDIEYVVLPSSLIPPQEAPSNEEIERWFDTHQKNYRIPEKRTISYIKIAADDLKDLPSITEEQIAAQYNKNKAEFSIPEKRHIQQIVFSSKKDAEKALNSLKKGKKFEEIVSDYGKKMKDSDLGVISKKEIFDTKIADVAFSLPKNSLSPIIQSNFGSTIVHVGNIIPEKITPLSAVKEKIRQDIAMEEAVKKLPDIIDSYQNQREKGLSMKEAAAQMQIKYTSLDEISLGEEPKNNTLPFIQKLIHQAFQTEIHVENDPIEIDLGYIFYEVDAIQPAKNPPLAEVKNRIIQDIEAQKRLSILEKKAKDSIEKLRKGVSMDEIAKEFNLPKQERKNLTRETKDAEWDERYINRFFSVPNNQSAHFSYPEKNSSVIFHVKNAKQIKKEIPKEKINENKEFVKVFFAEKMTSDFIEAFIGHLQARHPIEVNYEMMKGITP